MIQNAAGPASRPSRHAFGAPQDEGRFALADAAVGAGLAAIYSSSLWILIAAALIGAWLGYKGERLGRFYVERAPDRSRSR